MTCKYCDAVGGGGLTDPDCETHGICKCIPAERVNGLPPPECPVHVVVTRAELYEMKHAARTLCQEFEKLPASSPLTMASVIAAAIYQHMRAILGEVTP